MSHEATFPRVTPILHGALVLISHRRGERRFARAELHLDITHGKIQPMPIAIPVFAGERRRARRERSPGVMSADLERSGLFQPIDPKAFVDKEAANAHAAALQRLARDQCPGAGDRQRRSLSPTGGSQVEFRLWDVFAEQQLTGLRYTTTPENWRRIAHIIADAIYKRITGEDGYFDTRIVYICGKRAAGPAHQAPRDHGPGRRQQPLS